jgi:hypothetical protein
VTHLLRIVAGFAIVAAICFAAVSGGDRETATPPPDAVAEGFFREVVTERFDRARPYVASAPTDRELQWLLARIESMAGHVDDVQADLVTRTDAKALVTVRLESASGSDAIPVSLSFSNGEWRVDRVP